MLSNVAISLTTKTVAYFCAQIKKMINFSDTQYFFLIHSNFRKYFKYLSH